MRIKLTDAAIQKLRHPANGQEKYWDSVVPGFGLRITAKSKAFFVAYGKKRQIKTIGKYPEMSLKSARIEAQKFQLTKTSRPDLKLLSEAREAYLDECHGRLRSKTYSQYATYLQLIDKRYLSDIKRSDIDITHPHTVATWKAFFNWCVLNEIADRNPFASIKAKNGSRSRTLSDEELKLVWNYHYPPYSNFLKLLILTGMRKMEALNVQLADDEFVLTPEHTKNRSEHRFPATAWAQSIYCTDSFNGWSKCKSRIDNALQIPHWTIHDLRRTFATIHAKIGTPIHVIEALLNHKSGEISGLKAIYIQHNFSTEAKQALENYEAYLQDILA